MFRPDLDVALGYSDGAQGGRPFDPVKMFKSFRRPTIFRTNATTS